MHRLTKRLSMGKLRSEGRGAFPSHSADVAGKIVLRLRSLCGPARVLIGSIFLWPSSILAFVAFQIPGYCCASDPMMAMLPFRRLSFSGLASAREPFFGHTGDEASFYIIDCPAGLTRLCSQADCMLHFIARTVDLWTSPLGWLSFDVRQDEPKTNGSRRKVTCRSPPKWLTIRT